MEIKMNYILIYFVIIITLFNPTLCINEQVMMNKDVENDNREKFDSTGNKHKESPKYIMELYHRINKMQYDVRLKGLFINALIAQKSEGKANNSVYIEYISSLFNNAYEDVELVIEPNNETPPSVSPNCKRSKQDTVEIPATFCLNDKNCLNTMLQPSFHNDIIIVEVTSIINYIKMLVQPSPDDVSSNTLGITLELGSSGLCYSTPYLVVHSVSKSLYMDIEMAESVKIVKKRDITSETNIITEKERSSPCHLQRWVVNFSELGWKSIIIPKTYVTNICVGTCFSNENKILPNINISMHAFLKQEIYRVQNKGRKQENEDVSILGSCVPIKTGHMAIIYSKDGTFSVGIIHDVTAESCGCL